MKKFGLISDFSSKTKRLGRFHYLIVVDLDLTPNQTLDLIQKIFPSKLPNNFQLSQLKKTVFPIIKVLYMRILNQSR